MAAVRAPRGRRRRDASLGQIPLSSGEIELYSRQDEAARRRRRLLAVRDQERRLAQQVTQRYRNNLQKLQRGKSKKSQKQLSVEQQKLLTELHVRYQNSLQSMGTAQRSARLKLLELMEQAQEEKEKWTYNRQITRKQRTIEAEEAQEEAETVRTARRRQVEQNMERLKLLSGQQRQQASARARQEQEVARRRAKDKQELEKLRQMQSPEEVFVTPRPHEKDVVSYQFTRTHCLATPTPGTERPAVTVIRHNRKFPTAMRGKDEATKYRDEMDQKRERDRLIVEEQEETAAERGKHAFDEVTSIQQGQQALEWLALVDKMERRARGQELGDGEGRLDAGEVDGAVDDPERMAERAFARMLGLDEESVELSAFSIETDDDRSVGLADSDHEHLDGDKAAGADMGYRVKLKATKRSDSFDLRDGIESSRPATNGKGDQAERTPENPLKATTFGDLQREELEKLKKAKDMRERGVHPEGVAVSLKPRGGVRDGEYEDKLDTSKARTRDVYRENGDNVPLESPPLQWNKHMDRYDHVTASSTRQHQYGYDTTEERPEGTDSEEEMNPGAGRLPRSSIQKRPSGEQELVNVSAADRAQAFHAERDELLSSNSASIASDDEEFYEKTSVREGKNAGVVAVGEDQRSLSESSFAPSQKSLSRLDQMGDDYSFQERSEDTNNGEDEMESGAEHLSRTPFQARSTEKQESRKRLGSKRSEMVDAERDDLLSSISASEDAKANVQLNTRRSRENRDNGDHVLEASYLQRNEHTSSGDQVTSGTAGQHQYSYDNAKERPEGTHYDEEANLSAFHQLSSSPQSKEALTIDEIDEKASPDTLDYGTGHMSASSVQETATERLGSRRVPSTGRAHASPAERDEHTSPPSSASRDEEFHEKNRVLGGKISRMVAIDEEDQRSLSESSFTPSQKSLSRLDQVVNDRARSLGQRFIDQHMMSFSSSEGLSEDEGDAETELQRPSIGSDDMHSFVTINPHDPYRQQIHHQARRSSTSAVSVAQYSLPPSDTQSSFDDSLNQLHPGYGDDSFVNELVPMFPKRELLPPARSFEEDSEALEEYDVQLVAPNMSRMLTSERRTSFGRSRQRLVHQEHQSAGTDRSRRHSASTTGRQPEEIHASTRIDKRAFSSTSRRSSSRSSSPEQDAKNFDTSMEPSPARQQPVIEQTRRLPTVAVGPETHQLPGSSQARRVEQNERDNLSDVSSESGVSSLGFTVQLNLAAGTTRRRDAGGDRREISNDRDSQQNKHAQEDVSDDDLDDQSIVSERSFASSSSMSMDAHFNYLVNMTSAVGTSLPLHLRLPAMIYGKKDMTKPPAPMAWSPSSVSSVATASEVDPNEGSEKGSHSARRSIPRSDSSRSDSFLEEQHFHPRHPEKMDRQARDSDLQHAPPVSYQSEKSDASSVSGRTGGAGKAVRLTFDDTKGKIAQLPPPPLSSINMSQPPAPMQNIDRSLDDSLSSLGQHPDDVRPSGVHQVPPPLLGSVDMSQPPAPLQNFSRGLDDSQSSSEQHFEERSFEKHEIRRHSNRSPYEGEEERKQDDSSSESGAFSDSNASFGGLSANSRRQSVKKAEKIVIPVQKSHGDSSGDSDEDQSGKEVSLAEAFQRRHPGFGHRVESHRDKLKRQRDKQLEQQQQQSESDQNTPAKRDMTKGDTAQSARGHSTADPLPPEKQELLDRLARGSRAKISNREMKERSHRLYHQLPEVVERKRQEEVMRRRRERLNELREQEKERRLQQKQRRQQQQMRR